MLLHPNPPLREQASVTSQSLVAGLGLRDAAMDQSSYGFDEVRCCIHLQALRYKLIGAPLRPDTLSQGGYEIT